MKRPAIFYSLFLIPVVFSIVFFWMRHLISSWSQTPVPLLERFSMMAPSATMILATLLIIAGIWSVLLWRQPEKERRLRPLAMFGFWMLLVLWIGAVSMGDIWHLGNAPITEAQKTDILLREFGLKDPLAVNGLTMFANLLGNVLKGIFAILAVVIASLGAGTWIRRMFPETVRPLERLLLILGAGFAAWMLLLVLLGMAGILALPLGGIPLVTVVLAIGVILGLWREGAFLWKLLWTPCLLAWEKKDAFLQPFFVVGLMLVTAATFLHVIRPIPIGWDDIGVYMNVPSLVAEHGALVGGFGTYNWGMIMSLGFLVWQTPYIAMLFSYLGGILAFFGLYVVLKSIREHASPVPLFLVTVFAMAPFVLFQLGDDMKIDLALLFMGTVSMLIAVLLWKNEHLRRPSWYLLLGVILGTALGIKMTAILLIIMILGLLLLRMAGGWGITAMVAWSLVLLILGNVFAIGGLEISGIYRIVTLSLLAVIGLVASVLTILRTHTPGKLVTFVAISLAGILLAFSPWIVFNVQSWCTASCPPLSVTMLTSSMSSNPAIPAAPVSVTTATGNLMQEDLQQSGGTEELGRYAGFDQSALHYLSLPFDTSFSINVSGDYVTVGWVFLSLLLLAAAWALTQHIDRSEPHMFICIYGLLLLFFFGGSLWGGNAAAPWVLHTLTIGIGLLLLLSIVYIAHHTHVRESLSEEMRHLLSRRKLTLLTQAPLTIHVALLTVLYGFLWMYLASGVVWYGITGIIGVLLVGAVALDDMRDREAARIPYVMFIVLVTALWIVPMYVYKLSTSETSIKTFSVEGQSLVSDFQSVTSFDTRHFLLFKAGVLNQDSGLQFFNGEYYAAATFLNRDINAKIYRVGTLLPYFIHSNDTRIATDNQLDQFVAGYLPEANPEVFVRRLYDAGFRYIIFDLGTDSIDKTQEKTLTKKVDMFQSFVNNRAVGEAERTPTGVRVFTEENPYLKEVLRASGFIIWSLQPAK